MAEQSDFQTGADLKSYATIERTASGKLVRKLKAVQGDSPEILNELCDRATDAFANFESVIQERVGD